MKSPTLIAALAIFFAISVGADPAHARSNYVVIGAFMNKNNAIHFTDAARTHHLEAGYAINKVRKLYYVFVLHTEDTQKAVDEALRLRANSEYTGAWVYHGVLGDEQESDGVDITTSWPLQPPPTAVGEKILHADSAATTTTEVPQPPAQQLPEAGEAMDPKAASKVFIFKVYTPDQKPKEARIEVIDVDREKKVTVLKANEPVVLKPINTSGDLRFDCQKTGYRRETQACNFKNPELSETGVTVEGNAIVVPFELVRLKKGDKSILFNIYFYKDAAIMRPESKYELDELLVMMNENPNYKVKFHGHTNGKASGKIIEVGETKNFFSLTGSKEGFGSAKQLSEERALLIKEYLVSEGVDAERMEIKAWGGKKPIYPKDHSQASANVRVEVEILQD